MEQYSHDIRSIKELLESYILGDKTPTNSRPSAASRVKRSKDSSANYLRVRNFVVLMTESIRVIGIFFSDVFDVTPRKFSDSYHLHSSQIDRLPTSSQRN
jgi:hypothetical protein